VGGEETIVVVQWRARRSVGGSKARQQRTRSGAGLEAWVEVVEVEVEVGGGGVLARREVVDDEENYDESVVVVVVCSGRSHAGNKYRFTT